jgi:hypothetical protein
MKQLITHISEWFWGRVERSWRRTSTTVNARYDPTTATQWKWSTSRYRPRRFQVRVTLTCIWEVEARILIFGREFRFYDKTPFVYLYGYLENAYFDRMNQEWDYGYDQQYYGHE